MGVSWRPIGVNGRNGRLVHLTAVTGGAGVEFLAVGTWFVLVAAGGRSSAIAVTGLIVLVTGMMLKRQSLSIVIGDRPLSAGPALLGFGVLASSCWVGWLLLAETFASPTAGLLIAGAFLATSLSVLSVVSVSVAPTAETRLPVVGTVGPAIVEAIGASTMLASAWYLTWIGWTIPFDLFGRQVAIEIESAVIGALVFGVFALVAQLIRFRTVGGR